MSTSPQFTLYSHRGPNPWKVVGVLEELGLSYKLHPVTDHKGEAYLKINPNGRMPALVDHWNNDFTIWESGAIVLYLVEKYDLEYKLHFKEFEKEALAKQWLMFQMSGQGPYWGQYFWFKLYAPEKVPFAEERYLNEIKRVLGVLERVLQDKTYLVDETLSYADMCFLPWVWAVEGMGGYPWRKDFPAVARWVERLEQRAAVQKMKELNKEA